MSIGEPKHRPPAFIKSIINKNYANWSKYPPTLGLEKLNIASVNWLNRRYNLSKKFINHRDNIVQLAGTREGLFNVALAISPSIKNNNKPAMLLPNPFYQVYAGACRISGAEPIFVRSLKENNFFYYEDEHGGLKLPIPNLLGEFQIANVATAIATLRNIDELKISENHIKEGITNIQSIARLQEIKSGKLKNIVKNNKLFVGETFRHHITPFEGSVVEKESLEFTKIKLDHPLRTSLSEVDAIKDLFKISSFSEPSLVQFIHRNLAYLIIIFYFYIFLADVTFVR